MTGNQEGGRRKRRSNEEIKRLVTEFGAGDATEPVLPQSWFGVEHRSRLLPFIPVSLEEALAFLTAKTTRNTVEGSGQSSEDIHTSEGVPTKPPAPARPYLSRSPRSSVPVHW